MVPDLYTVCSSMRWFSILENSVKPTKEENEYCIIMGPQHGTLEPSASFNVSQEGETVAILSLQICQCPLVCSGCVDPG